MLDFTENDMRTMYQQGDAVDFVRHLAGFTTTRDTKDEETIRCPWCHTPPQQRCTTPRGNVLTSGIHEARITAYRDAAPLSGKPGSWPT